jgi:drug/metabolite transporter (DMT)-like permease
MTLGSIVFIFFIIAILKPLIFKVCAVKLDHRTAPIFISSFLLLGTVLTLPFYHTLLATGFVQLLDTPPALFFCLLKGIVIWYAIFLGQKLTQHSLSSSRFVLPPALALAAFVNMFLGEILSTGQWISVLGLSLLGIAFFFKGHLKELTIESKKIYLILIAITVILISTDFYTVSHSNWYVHLFLSNAVLFIFCLIQRKPLAIWRSALLSKEGALAGFSMVVYEFIKFSAMITYVPVTTITSVQAAATPIILALTALIWKERSWQEQLIWGVLTTLFLMIALI